MSLAVSIWAPLIYQYAVGGALFLVGLLVAIFGGACDLRRRGDRLWLLVSVLGLGTFFAGHLTLYLLAVYVSPATAGGGP